MELTCRNLLMVYKESSSPDYGSAEVFIDGRRVASFSGNSAGAWDNPRTAVLLDEEMPGHHSVEVRMEDSDSDKLFTIYAFGYTE